MRREIFLGIALLLVEAAVCIAAPPPDNWVLPNFARRLDVTVANPSASPVDTLVTLRAKDVHDTAPGFPGSLAIAVMRNPPGTQYPVTVIPSQADDLEGDEAPDEFEFPVALKPHETKQVEIYYSTTLHGRIVYPRSVRASHNYGYNHQTAALESELIGYRMYGGFFLDVEGRAAGHTGLYNDLNGYLSAHGNFAVGKDIFHVGDTLGLGGLFLERAGKIYRPPMNVPDYAHKPSPPDVPHYRVVADGPLRAIIDAILDHWQVDNDVVAVRARYTIDSGEGFVRCQIEVAPARIDGENAYRVGVGIRDLPLQKFSRETGLIELSGEQAPGIGRLALALYFNPKMASYSSPMTTPEGGNQVAIFDKTLRRGQTVDEDYAIAAAWERSGVGDLLHYLAGMKGRVNARVVISNERVEQSPQPRRVEGEAY